MKRHNLMLASSIFALACVTPIGAAFAQASPGAPASPTPADQAATAPGTAAAPAAAASDNNGAQLEEIVVTAQRTSQKLQDVPISVAAVSAAGLQARGITNAFTLGNAVPGLQVTMTGTTTTPYLRGVGSNAANPNNEASVATYIDGVYIAAPYANTLSFNNIDRIEVLKGPQGTLFGRNATGGVIQIITRTPQHDPSMDLSIGYGNYQTTNVGAYVTGGLTDTVAADFAVQYKDQNKGFGYDLNRHTDVYKGWEGSMRSKVLWQPTPSTSVTIAGDYSRLNYDFLNYVLPKGVVSPIDPDVFYKGRYITNTDTGASSNTKTYGASVTIKQDLGFAQLVDIAARRIAQGENIFDADNTPVPIISFHTPQSVKTWSEELQLNSKPGGPLSWTVGGFYFHNDAGYVPARLVGVSFGPLPTSEFDIQGIEKTNSYSAYGQATYAILSNLKLTGGLRYTHERNDVSWAVGTSPDALGAPITGKTGFNRLTWRGALDYEFVSDVHAYVSYNRGIKSGGFDLLSPGAAPYNPEVLDAYEAGLKSELFDRRLRINIAGFLYKYRDIQVSANPHGSIITTNAARATIKGIDADFEAALTHNLRLSGGVGYTDAKFDSFPDAVTYDATGAQEFTPGDLNGYDATGNRLVRTPKFTGNLGLTYSVETSIGKLGASGSFYHNSGFYWDVDNRLKQPSYNVVGASLSWTDAKGVLGVRLWAENLTDAHYETSGVSAGGTGDEVIFGAPRTYGATLTGHF